jgi:putative ABC transport system permease protein
VAEPIADTLWPAAWSTLARTPAATQAASIDTLVDIIVALGTASFALAILNVFALLAVHRLRQRRSDAIRVALGATRGRLLRTRLRENRRDIGYGVILALATAAGAVAALRATWPAGLLPPTDSIPTAALAATTLLLLGLGSLNALTASRPPNPAHELAGGSATASRRNVRENAGIAIIQIALAVALASAALLLFRNGRVDADRSTFDADGLITADLTFATPLPPAESAAAYAAFLARTRDQAGLRDAAISSPGTWLGIGTRDRIMFECGACAMGGMMLPLQMRMVSHHALSPGFFASLDLPMLQGREFNAADTIDGERVALVNETFARTGFEAGRPIGKRIQIGGLRGEWFTVIGVVPDIAGSGVGAPRGNIPALFVPILQMPTTAATLTARAALETQTTEELAALLPAAAYGITIAGGMAMTERLQSAVAPIRWAGILLAGLAAVALLLALHGMHASLDAQVRNRRRELAVRAAVGASPVRLAALILGRTSRLLAAGIGTGIALAITAARMLESRIGGIPVLDAAPLIAAAFACVALAGGFAAARRAARTPPGASLAEF